MNVRNRCGEARRSVRRRARRWVQKGAWRWCAQVSGDDVHKTEDMGKEKCKDMRVDADTEKCTEKCKDMRVDTNADQCEDMCEDKCADRHAD